MFTNDFFISLLSNVFSNTICSKITTNKEKKEKEILFMFINKCKIFKYDYLDKMEEIYREYQKTKNEDLKNEYLSVFKESLNYLKELYCDFDLKKSVLYKNTLFCAQFINYKTFKEYMQSANVFVSAFCSENLFSFIYLLNNQLKEDDAIKNRQNSSFFSDRLKDDNMFNYSLNDNKTLMLRKTLKDYELKIKKKNTKQNNKLINEIIKIIAINNIYYFDKYEEWLPQVKMSKKEAYKFIKSILPQYKQNYNYNWYDLYIEYCNISLSLNT